ncbi:MAG: sulfatase [Labilithrix sp.]|nr:sulfatase [Labilithrix sp.]
MTLVSYESAIRARLGRLQVFERALRGVVALATTWAWTGGCTPSKAREDAGVSVGVDAGVVSVSADAGAPPSLTDAAPPADLNVLVLSVDSLRADMPWAGYPRPIAPTLTELEKRSVSYTRAYSISSYTSMSLGGLLGGKLPSGMTRSGFFFGRYGADNLMFPELLKEKGIKTLAAHAHGYFANAGFDQGFDVWQIVPGIIFKNETDPNVTSPQHAALAEKILSDPSLGLDAPGTRFFAWFHFLDPHDQYVSHEKDGIPPYGKTLRDRYDAEVTFTDRHLGKLLDFVASQPWGKRTAIIVTADHGEAFGEHNQYNHGFELWENLVRVPMFFVVPGAAPRRIDAPRSAIDLAPTILELFGLPPDPGFEGKSLVAELRGAPAEPRDVVVDLPMTSDNDKRRAIIRDKQKIIAFGKDEALRLYDLAADPEEKSPITRGEAFTEMAKVYREHAKTVKEVAPTSCNVGCLNRAYANKR